MDKDYPKSIAMFRGVPTNLDAAMTWEDGNLKKLTLFSRNEVKVFCDRNMFYNKLNEYFLNNSNFINDLLF